MLAEYLPDAIKFQTKFLKKKSEEGRIFFQKIQDDTMENVFLIQL